MGIQGFYPVFESGQVLTSEHLNNIVDYLEPQDRLTRTRLNGIGIVCGGEPDWNATAKTLTLSCCVAVTSEGYLIAEDEVAFDRFRPYAVPIPSGPAATPEDKSNARYPFLFDGENQREAFELLPTDFQPAPGEAAPTALNDSFVADKTVLLFLECNLEALKNCDINDCSDKGSEMSLTVRRLLVAHAVADTILAQEAAIAGRPVDRANHPRLGLAPLAFEKINPALHQIDSLAKLYDRTLSVAGIAGQQLQGAMRNAWDAYKPLLADMYPASRFPNGPIPNHHFLNPLAAVGETPALVQYLHGAMHDMVRSYNEFIGCAARFDADCCPHPGRFPKHVLAGDVLPRPVAFDKAPKTLAEYAAFDPLAAAGGPAPEGAPAARRHHFVPSLALDSGGDKVAELRSVFARMVLLAQTYFTRNLLAAAIQLTPSRDGAAPLGERAIPFFYGFKTTGDLFGNWSWRKARDHLLGSIFSYQFTAAAKDHPLLLRQDDQDFIRIEGVVGKPLGTAMAQLIQQKQNLDAAFAIEPVFIGYGVGQGDAAKAATLKALRQLLLCRLRDVDVLFLMIMAGLFAFMVWIVQVLGRLDATKTTTKKVAPAPAPAADANVRFILAQPAAFLKLDLAQQTKLRFTSEKVLTQIRTEKFIAADLVKKLAIEGAGDTPVEKVAVASIYDKVRDKTIGGELFDRVRSATDDLGIAGDKDELAASIYPAIALMARAEEMMAVTAVASVAEFDEAKFGTAFRGFADAYENYSDKAETDPNKSSKEIADVNIAIAGNRGAITAAAGQLSAAAITAEIEKRLKAMFEDMTMPRYAEKHTGLEHKAGVPVGGTFVLIYGSRQDIAAGMKQALGDFAKTFGNLFAKLVGGNPPAIDADKVVKDILASSTPQSDDILDEFVVLGDFCLPYRCCDTDCGDDVVMRRVIKKEGVVRAIVASTDNFAGPPPAPAPAPTPAPTPLPAPTVPSGVTTGAVEISVFERARTGENVAFNGALLIVTDLSNNKSQEQPLREAMHKMVLNPGKYGFVATAGTRKSATVQIALNAGATEKVALVIV